MPECHDYQVRHLFLLIGENPLPNYVAARTLLKFGGIAYLIYTSQTELQAKRLRDCLDACSELSLQDAQLISIDGYESDSYHIHQEVERAIQKLPQDDSVGLNYTGGTKAMAVHAYHAFIQARPNVVFSYLDSRRLELCIDQKNGERFHKKVLIHLTLEEIFDLHNLSLKRPASSAPKLPEAAIALAQLHLDKDIAASWRSWCDNVLKKEAKNEKDKYLSESKLKQVVVDLRALPSEIVEVLSSHFPTTSGSLSLETVQSIKSLSSTEAFCKWLDGTWLEEYTLQQIQSLPEQYKIFDSATSFPIEDPKKVSANDFFEFDVAFTRGYQLFALSCTTDSTKGRCKQKLFEAYLRAKQLGGDEARVALVCCSDTPDSLKAQLETMLDNPKIAVFGRQQLANLSEHIESWMIKNDREAQ